MFVSALSGLNELTLIVMMTNPPSGIEAGMEYIYNGTDTTTTEEHTEILPELRGEQREGSRIMHGPAVPVVSLPFRPRPSQEATQAFRRAKSESCSRQDSNIPWNGSRGKLHRRPRMRGKV